MEQIEGALIIEGIKVLIDLWKISLKKAGKTDSEIDAIIEADFLKVLQRPPEALKII